MKYKTFSFGTLSPSFKQIMRKIGLFAFIAPMNIKNGSRSICS